MDFLRNLFGKKVDEREQTPKSFTDIPSTGERISGDDKTTSSRQTPESPSGAIRGTGIKAKTGPQEIDEFIGELRQLGSDTTTTGVPYILLGQSDRPVVANSTYVLCFTTKAAADRFAADTQARTGDQISLLPLNQSDALWTILTSRQIGPWQPPYGLVIDYGSKILGGEQRVYDREEILQIGPAPFKAGLASLPRPGAVTLRIKLGDSTNKVTLDEVADRLNDIYAQTTDGMLTTQAKDKVVAIGNALNEAGGMGVMLIVHSKFRERNRMMARGLEHAWDGIGDWRG